MSKPFAIGASAILRKRFEPRSFSLSHSSGPDATSRRCPCPSAPRARSIVDRTLLVVLLGPEVDHAVERITSADASAMRNVLDVADVTSRFSIDRSRRERRSRWTRHDAFRWQTRGTNSRKNPNGQSSILPPSLPLSRWQIDENERKSTKVIVAVRT